MPRNLQLTASCAVKSFHPGSSLSTSIQTQKDPRDFADYFVRRTMLNLSRQTLGAPSPLSQPRENPDPLTWKLGEKRAKMCQKAPKFHPQKEAKYHTQNLLALAAPGLKKSTCEAVKPNKPL